MNPPSRHLTGRQVFALGFAATTSAAIGTVALASCTSPGASVTPAPTLNYGPAELPQPTVIRSSGGLLTATLTPAWLSADIGVGVGAMVTSYNYDGAIPVPNPTHHDHGGLEALEIIA